MTWRTDGKLKSAMRKPLRDVSNSAINKSSKKVSAVKINNKTMSSFKKLKLKNHHQQQKREVCVDGDPLHRLLFVHSDFSALVRQIDEVVVEAVKVKIDDEKREEINSFINFWSEIQSSLKLRVLKLQKALAVPCADFSFQLDENSTEAPVLNESSEHEVDTPEPNMSASVISPSPLVSWRATTSTAEVGKQLFILTPLPRPKTTISKPLADDGKSRNIVESTSELECSSPSKIEISDLSTVLTTPCLKNAPPVSCLLQEPYPKFSFGKIDKFHKSTPFPVGHRKFDESTDSESSGGDVSEKLGLKYPELIGIKPSCAMKTERRSVLEESPAWIRSPPKCCTLMEPLDQKPVKPDSPLKGCLQKLQQMSLAPSKQSSVYMPNHDEGNKIGAGNSVMVESTPLWKGAESVLKTGKRPGENTLKKELWTRFEAASFTNGFELDFQESSRKGFLDRLEEVSCDESTPRPA
ncbi:hypothetical protein RND81_05G061600 [Saponaria officinalis]|uniref:Uncharacterized protein n=1 Tax=Saponaria officinalis TaxID=3572 RepID=A0AAW1KTS6_SAPOF